MQRFALDDLRFRLRHSPVLWWAAAGTLALIAVITLSEMRAGASAARAAYGETALVVVTAEAIPAGQLLDRSSVALVDRPLGLLPNGYLTDLPRGATARTDLVAGEVVVGSRLAGNASSLAARIPPGHRAVAVPIDGAVPIMEAGDRIDLVVTGDDRDGGAATVWAASGVEVLWVEEAESVTVALTEDAFPVYSAAVTRGVVSMAVAQGTDYRSPTATAVSTADPAATR